MLSERYDELDKLHEEYLTWMKDHPNAPHQEWKEVQQKLNGVLEEKNQINKSNTEKLKER